MHHGTSRVAARVAFLEKDGVAHLKLASPIFAFLGDRFVLRDPSEQHTIAGGIVLDPDLAKHRKSSIVPEDVDLCLRSEIASSGFVRKEMLLRKSHFSTDEINEALKRLERANEIGIRDEIAAEMDAWEKLRAQAMALIDEAHKGNPQRAGLDLNELRGALREQTAEVFAALIADLGARDFVRAGSAIARAAHRPALPKDLEAVATRIREVLSQKPFDPPGRREIELDRHAQQVLRYLIETEEVIEISPDLVLLRENFERMKSAVIDFISKNGPATVSELREALHSSRRIMVPLLEHIDRDGVTRRVADRRTLGESARLS